MRRKLSALLMFLILSFTLLTKGETSDDAEALRSFLQSHYGVTILMREESLTVHLEDSEIHIIPEGNTAFQTVYTGNRRFIDLLRLMDDEFSVYPPEFFSRFSSPSSGGLRFALVDEVLWKGIRTGGVQTTTNGYYDIILSLKDTEEQEIHHELWHAMERRIWIVTQMPSAVGRI